MGRKRSVYIGSFTEGAGTGSGISLVLQDVETGALGPARLVAETPSPSFLAWHPDGRHLYAVNETDPASVTAYAVDDDGGLTHLGTLPTGGSGACHLVVHPSGRYLLSAGYGSGSLSVHSLNPDGSLAALTEYVERSGSGPNPARQETPHVHHVRVDPSGRWVLAVDLGTDAVLTYELDLDNGTLAPSSVTYTSPGAGPRHLAFGRGVVYVVGELDSTVSTFAFDTETGELTAQAVGPSVVAEGVDGNHPSEIAIDDAGRFLYVANRGLDVVTTLRISANSVHPVADVPAGGAWPRHLALIGDHLYVANERSHQVTHFVLDPVTGVPSPVPDPIEIPSPACILPALTTFG